MNREKLFSVTLDDCDMQSYSAGGAGGQHRDHGNSAVRITHRASGAVGTASDSRSHEQNKKAAFRRMVATAKFKVWLNREIMRRDGKLTAEQRVEKDLDRKNLRIETRENGTWRPVVD